jgi:hypothetical protein
MKALDIVITPKGGIAFITETVDNGSRANITFIETLNIGREYNAWWDASELTVIDSIPKMIATATAHPFGRGKDDVDLLF